MPTNTPTPRDLDPNAKNKDVENKDAEKTQPVDEPAPEKDVPMIVHRQPYTDSEGVQKFKEHRVPVSEWAAYEKEHNL